MDGVFNKNNLIFIMKCWVRDHQLRPERVETGVPCERLPDLPGAQAYAESLAARYEQGLLLHDRILDEIWTAWPRYCSSSASTLLAALLQPYGCRQHMRIWPELWVMVLQLDVGPQSVLLVAVLAPSVVPFSLQL